MKRLTGTDYALLLLTFLLGAAGAAYFTWPELLSEAAYATDARQCFHYVAYHTDTYRPDDLLLRYARFNESPVQDLVFYLGTFFIDGLLLAKIIALLSYGACSALFFLLCRLMFASRLAGVLAAVFFAFFPDQIAFYTDGFSKAWMIPLVLIGLYLLRAKAYPWLIALMPFGALAYPPVPIFLGLTSLVHVGVNLSEERDAGFPLLRSLVPAGVATVAVLGVKYLSPPAGIGHLNPGSVLRAMPEMYAGGLAPYLPTPPLHETLFKHFNHPFVLFSALVFLAVLRREKVVWERVWTSVLIASLVGYVLADRFFMYLYIPNRYIRYSVAVLMVLWQAANWTRVLHRFRRPAGRCAALGALLAVTAVAYRDDLVCGKHTMDRSRFVGVAAAVRALPPRILLAGHPRTMDDLVLQGRRSVLCNYKLAHPWFAGYYGEIKRRTYASLAALYADDVGPINDLHTRYGVTHLVVDKYYLRRRSNGEPRKLYQNPYNPYLRSLFRDHSYFLLRHPPPESILYEDRRYILVRLPLKSHPTWDNAQ